MNPGYETSGEMEPSKNQRKDANSFTTSGWVMLKNGRISTPAQNKQARPCAGRTQRPSILGPSPWLHIHSQGHSYTPYELFFWYFPCCSLITLAGSENTKLSVNVFPNITYFSFFVTDFCFGGHTVPNVAKRITSRLSEEYWIKIFRKLKNKMKRGFLLQFHLVPFYFFPL